MTTIALGYLTSKAISILSVYGDLFNSLTQSFLIKKDQDLRSSIDLDSLSANSFDSQNLNADTQSVDGTTQNLNANSNLRDDDNPIVTILRNNPFGHTGAQPPQDPPRVESDRVRGIIRQGKKALYKPPFSMSGGRDLHREAIIANAEAVDLARGGSEVHSFVVKVPEGVG